MIVSAPPFQVNQELWGLLGCSPCTTCQCCHPMSDGQVHPFNKAVLSRPEKPIPCRATVRSACVSRRITCVTRTSLRRR
jgi:hypothetical protein